jgi:Kef-type K+ transport system membrane component KefB
MHHTTQTIFSIAIILFFTNLTRAVSVKWKIPPVIGLLIIGKIIGPSFLNIIQIDPTINWIAQLGVLFLISVPVSRPILRRLKEDSKLASFPALGGILVPFAGGFLVTYLYNHNLTAGIVIGIIFSAASISVPLMTLIDIDKFKSAEGEIL